MRKTFCDRCGAVVDDGENGDVLEVSAHRYTRDDGGDRSLIDSEYFELCPKCYEEMLGADK